MGVIEAVGFFRHCHAWTLYENVSVWAKQTVLLPLPEKLAELIPKF
jgi:hypothetical protein